MEPTTKPSTRLSAHQWRQIIALVKDKQAEDPLSGQLFVFINRKCIQCKVLYFDRSGYSADTVSHLQLLRQIQVCVEENELLKQENASVKHQQDWFKQQLPGEKSEKRQIDNPNQLALGEVIKDIDPLPVVVTESVTCERRKKQRPEDSVTDQETHALDETPGKAGRKSKGKMQTGYFWSFYGDRDGVAFMNKLDEEIEELKRCYPNATYIGVAGGAKENWRYLTQHTPAQILDFYHTSEYLAGAAEALFSESKSQRKFWLEDRLHCLKNKRGVVKKILVEIESAGLPKKNGCTNRKM